MAIALETEKLCKSFGALTVADNIDFRLESGARHALIGPNGAGKTTFVNMLLGAIAPSSGRILLAGEDITKLPQAKRVASSGLEPEVDIVGDGQRAKALAEALGFKNGSHVSTSPRIPPRANITTTMSRRPMPKYQYSGNCFAR